MKGSIKSAKAILNCFSLSEENWLKKINSIIGRSSSSNWKAIEQFFQNFEKKYFKIRFWQRKYEEELLQNLILPKEAFRHPFSEGDFALTVIAFKIKSYLIERYDVRDRSNVRYEDVRYCTSKNNEICRAKVWRYLKKW